MSHPLVGRGEMGKELMIWETVTYGTVSTSGSRSRRRQGGSRTDRGRSKRGEILCIDAVALRESQEGRKKEGQKNYSGPRSSTRHLEQKTRGERGPWKNFTPWSRERNGNSSQVLYRWGGVGVRKDSMKQKKKHNRDLLM